MTPLLSLVTGTFNRLPHLEAWIGSARDTLPVGLSYEFVICDGGSTDGTLDYLRAQNEIYGDVVLIEHGELRGAIRAFDDAARAAQGDYVLLGNDDTRFHPHALVAALAHLEAHPDCGAVAFRDNRPAPGYERQGYKVQTITARQNGTPVSVPYPQVGLIRRWLGDEAGWWGSEHPVMGQGHTYGGDAFLGARIWELGYTVDELPLCRVDDLIPNDTLREINHRAEMRNPAVYYKVYPQGPELPDAPLIENPQEERLRILYAPIYEPGYPHHRTTKRGLREALQNVGLVYEWDYLSEPKPDLAARAEAWQPHVILLQCHGIDRITESDLAATREVCPEAVICNWNGDVFTEHLISAPMLSLLRHVDLQLVVNANVLSVYAQHGVKAAYWQVAYEPTDDAHLPPVKAHDVVFLGNAYTPRRKALGEALRAVQGLDVGLYGFGWSFPSGNTLYQFDVGAALYQHAKIAIGDNQYPDERGFVSNRFFEALAAGAFLLHQRVNGLEALTGLIAGVHYAEWIDADDLQRQIRHWLKPRQEAKRREIAAEGQRFVREHHSFDARVRELFEVLLPMVEGEPAQEMIRDPI
jgi:hypothetical protein